MKNFDLDDYGVVEMTQQELLEINGGGGLGKYLHFIHRLWCGCSDWTCMPLK
ncbi:MAG: hypothetical protein FWD02_01600 [Bacteroidales bacterium]|nr:hypothetical protein [Bacteroidales bacterium]